jgi:hypothetical protein
MKKYILFLNMMMVFVVGRTQIDSSNYWQTTLFDTNTNFYQVFDLQNKYFINHTDSSDNEDNSSRNSFYRWANFWEHRVDNTSGTNGSIYHAVQKFNYVRSHIDNYLSQPGNTSADWKYLGPKQLPTQNYGIVTSIAVDKNDLSNNTIFAGTGASGLWKTTDGGLNWKNITGQYLSAGLGVYDIIIHPTNPNIIYIAIDFGSLARTYFYGSGIMKTINGGLTWTSYDLGISPRQERPILKLLMDPTNPSRIVAFGKNYIYRTTDGENWEEINPSIFPANFLTMCEHTTVMPKTVRDALFRPSSNNNTVYIATDGFEYDNQGVLAYCGAEVWKISNIFAPSISASDFEQIICDPHACNRFSLDITNLHPDRIYIAGEFTNGLAVYYIDLSNNSSIVPYCTCGNNSIISQNQWMFEFKMSEVEENAFGVCIYFFNYYTVNGNTATLSYRGVENTPPDSYYHTDTRSSTYIADNTGEYFFIGNDGGVSKVYRPSSSQPFTLSNINGNGLYITQLYGLGVCENYPDYYVGATQDNHLMSHNYLDPNSWKIQRSGTGDAFDVLIHPTNPLNVYYTSGGGQTSSFIGFTTDGFVNYIPIPTSFPAGEPHRFNMPLVINPGNQNEVFAGLRNIYKSTGWNGIFDLTYPILNYFSITNYSNIQNGSLNAIAIAPSHPQTIYASYGGPTWHSDTSALIKTKSGGGYHGEDWQRVQAMDAKTEYWPITGLAVAPDDPDKLWVTFGDFYDPNPNFGPNTRVLYSKDGGDNFTDITSSALPNLPVNCIKVIKDPQSGYKVFIGTDIGVFLYDTQTEKWTPFNHHLPPCIVTDIEIVLDDQHSPKALRIATFGYGIWETNLDCSTDAYEIISGTPPPWSTDMVKHHNIYITSGGSLTINSKISFVEGTGIIVERGGYLYVNGGTLTNACGSLWNGVEVLGDPSSIWRPQGYARFQNAVVENAVHGVYTVGGADPDHINGNVDPVIPDPETSAGGIIKAFNTNFRDNYYSVFISPCSFDKIDQFDNCTFETTTDMPFPYGDPGPLVRLDDLRSVYFHGCTFRTSQDYSPNHPKGIGIQSNNANFYLDGLCTSSNQNGCTNWQFSQFTNLDYGIKALAFSPTRTLRVDRATFTGNNTGIYLSAVSTAQVTRSNFNILIADTSIVKHYGGLYLDFCHGYKIEENIFTGAHEIPGSPSKSIGLIVNNSNVGADFDNSINKIYNNKFYYLGIGTLAENKNRTMNSPYLEGLTIKCNDYYSCNNDIAVTTYIPNNSQMGIATPQGEQGNDRQKPAGNGFSLPIPAFNYFNNCGNFDYWHHDPLYSIKKVQPTQYSNLSIIPHFVNGNYYSSDQDCCPSSFSPNGGGGIDPDKQMMSNAGEKADSLQVVLSSLIDGGDTYQLYNNVNSSTPPEATIIYNDLISKSPFLSDSVMVSAAKKETVLTADMITDVLSENPQAAKSDTVMNAVVDRTNTLADDQLSEIMQGLYIIGAKESLESNLSGYKNEYFKSLYDIIRFYDEDSLNDSPKDSIIAYLDKSHFLWTKYHEAFAMKENGEYSNANDILESLPDNYGFNQETSDYQHYLDYFNFLGECSNAGYSILEADSAQMLFLQSIAQDTLETSGIYARNLLIAAHNYQYHEPYILPDSSFKESRIKWHSSNILQNSNSIKVFPNPACNYTIVEYSTKTNTYNSHVDIYNEMGKRIRSINSSNNHDYIFIPLTGITSGPYIIKLSCNNKVVSSLKLIVNK